MTWISPSSSVESARRNVFLPVSFQPVMRPSRGELAEAQAAGPWPAGAPRASWLRATSTLRAAAPVENLGLSSPEVTTVPIASGTFAID